MPDLLAWAALHVPVDVRVIVLDMTAFASTGGFDAAACIEVLTLARAVDLTPGAAPFGPAPGVGVLAVPSARNDHRVKPPPMPTPASASAHASDPASGPEPPRRHLVLGGITPAMRMQLRAAGVMRHLEARNLCRTPGLAVARAIMLLERATPVTDGT